MLQREEEFKESNMGEVMRTMTSMADIVYFSARKLSSSRGGGICTDNPEIYRELEALVPLFEGFLTYGGISVREIEAMAVGLYETLDETMISQSPSFIALPGQCARCTWCADDQAGRCTGCPRGCDAGM